jgi:hypothetical protein
MPNPRRTKPRATAKPDEFWNGESRASLIGVVYKGLAADTDETLTGVTLIMPGRDEPLYISKQQAKAAHRRRPA